MATKREPAPRFMGQVVSEPEMVAGGWLAMVDVDGVARRAFVPSTMRAARLGDTVMVIKHPTTWRIDSIVTAHPVPVVTSPSAVAPPAAGTVSATPPSKLSFTKVNLNINLGSINTNPGASYSPAWERQKAEELDTTRAFVMDIKAAVQRLQDQVQSLMSQTSGLVDTTTAIRSTTNTNASRLNTAADVAVTTRQAAAEMRAALIAERIVK